MTKIDVLDHGYVRLVDSMGGDVSVVRSARVSYDADWRAGESDGSDAKLINYLWKNKHTSPFEAVEFQFEVQAPIFVFRQWHRHRTWSFNEISGRYAELPEVFYIPNPKDVGVQSKSSKQARDIADVNDDVLFRREVQVQEMRRNCERAFEDYRERITDGWPRELARIDLPLNTYSRMFAKIDLKNLLNFLDLRIHPHAQHEIRVYGEAMLKLIRPIVPVCAAAWDGMRN